MKRFLAIVVLVLIALASLGVSDTTTVADKGGSLTDSDQEVLWQELLN